jgi:hypothetical protein
LDEFKTLLNDAFTELENIETDSGLMDKVATFVI